MSGPGPAAPARRVDWSFLKGSSAVTLGIIAARVCGFAFSFLVARRFSTDAFGSVQYSITVATLVAIATVPFAEQVMPWFISRSSEDPQRLREVLGSGWTVLGALVAATFVVAVPALAFMGRLHPAVLVIAAGVTLFNVYAGLGRGFLAPGRLLAVYLGSNLLQMFAVVVALEVLGTGSTTPVLLIYGLSYVIPIAVLQAVRPFPLAHPDGLGAWRRPLVRDMVRFATPVWGSHALYTLSYALDVLLLARYRGEAAVGVYAITKTIVMGFSFLPQGITVLLMPRVAASSDGAHRSMLVNALGATVAVSALAFAVYLAVYRWFIETFVGRTYYVSLLFGALMALSAVMYGIHAILTSYLVGRNRPALETASRLVVATVMLGAGVVLVPRHGAVGAAWANVAAAVAGPLSYAVLLSFGRSRRSATEPSAR